MKNISLIFAFLCSSLSFAQDIPVSDLLHIIRPQTEVLWDVSMKKLDVATLAQYDHQAVDLTLGVLRSIRETAALIVRNNDQIILRNITIGSESSVSIPFGLKPGDEWLGDFHTHPYKYESLSDLPFSPRDFLGLLETKNMHKIGYVKLIKSGAKYFALEVRDPDKVKEYYQAQKLLADGQGQYLFDYLYKKFYSINRGQSIQEIQKNSLRLIMGSESESGIRFIELD